MTVGGGIALVVIGAILAFAIQADQIWGINLDLIGYIFMGAGVLVFIIGLIVAFRRRETVSETHVVNDPATGDQFQRSVSSADDTPVV